MSERCETCCHWTPPNERTDFAQAARFEHDKWDDNAQDGIGGMVRAEEADRLFGLCNSITLGSDLPEGPPPLAVTRDASDYEADLFTQAEFGCVLHAPTTNQPGERPDDERSAG